MAAMRRRLLPVLALCRAAPEPRPHCRFLHSPSLLDAVAASASPSPNLLSRSSGSIPPTSAAAVVAAAPRGFGSLELLSRQLGGWLPSSWTLLRGVAALRVTWRSTPEGPAGMVLMLVGANVAAYALCRLAGPRFKMNHFTTSLDNFKSGRLHTLLTSAFSHINVNHLVNNMTRLYFFGSSGIGGWKTPMLGGSGAVNAIVLLKIFLYPRDLLYLHFVIPVPASLVGARLIGADLWRIKKGRNGVSGSTHLGGTFVAALVCAKLKGWI